MSADTTDEAFDVLIVGAGMSGICALHSIRTRFPNWRVRVLDSAPSVGGTWYWNRYPGARFDSESLSYTFSFDQKLLDEWHWKERFSAQPDTLAYINFVADRLNLRPNIQLNTRIVSARWSDDEHRRWIFADETGRSYSARFFVSCLGFLSNPTLPAIPGIQDFKGQAFHTSRWPTDMSHRDVVGGKRVGIIGTGATGIQTITALAKIPELKSLTVFQKQAMWAAPLRNTTISKVDMDEERKKYAEIFKLRSESPTGFIHSPDKRKSNEATPEERLKLWESLYNKPGMGKWLSVFSDTYTDREANNLYSAFMADKIRARVNDPDIAEKLVPKDHGFGLARVPLESGYYEVYNQPNIHLADISVNSIEKITPTGITLQDGTRYQLDVLIYATGFNAITGAFVDIDFRGKDNVPLMARSGEADADRAAWLDFMPQTYLGITVPKFPNMFMVLGPHQPFGNATPNIEHAVKIVTSMLETCYEKGITYVEATEEAADYWNDHVVRGSEGALLNEVDSWMTGINRNVGRVKRGVIRYAGSTLEYRRQCAKAKESGWDGLVMLKDQGAMQEANPSRNLAKL
ncbi:hypothetical protein K4K59_004074 [Colletotrichum sp. SAR11_240]|nr:hypothetical protein K4K59_004074 [Colletotrichum sp. SAR11_240]